MGLKMAPRRIIGAIFCKVARIMQLPQLRPSMVGGNQKWNGAAPSFIRREITTIEEIKMVWVGSSSVFGSGEIRTANNKREEARD